MKEIVTVIISKDEAHHLGFPDQPLPSCSKKQHHEKYK